VGNIGNELGPDQEGLNKQMSMSRRLDRRSFLHLSAGATAAALASQWIPKGFALGHFNPSDQAATASMPNRPRNKPLDWRARADAFDSYVMDPHNKILRTRPDGTTHFASALEGTGDGGLTTFAPLLLGKLLRGNQVDALLPSMAAYFSDEADIFLDGTHADLCEYWYLMNVNALADAIVGLHYRHDPLWRSRIRRSADRLIALARQIKYDFNDQGYRFNESVPFTNKDIYRQPDTIGGYAYVMIFAHEFLGDSVYLDEARKAIGLYQSFRKNPWYEVPSGALASLAAARLSRTGADFDMEKILHFVLDPGGRPLQTGEWGGQEVNGLMAGFCTEPTGQAYSMESLMTLPYLLPVLRYRPEYATLIGRYLLNTAANMRLFYADCIPRENQSRPDLTSAVPYERLTRELDGRSPYVSGDYDSHRSIYGGAYALIWGELVKPTKDDFILQMDISRTDFLCEKSFPSYLYYNPWNQSKHVTLSLPEGRFDIYDLARHAFIGRHRKGSFRLEVPPASPLVVVVVPSEAQQSKQKNVLLADGVPFDYAIA
jgi:hypothetical protein